MKKIKAYILLLIIFSSSFNNEVASQELYPIKLTDSLWHNTARELRYKPDGSDFVITNGNRLFTRALYGNNTAFRVETGDRPEFALYMPGMGGNFKLGIMLGEKSKWLTQANTVEARYRAGSMIYTITDSLLGKGKIHLHILALANAEGFVLKAKAENISSTVKLLWAFGGASGKKFSRDGDMGPDPESNFYLKTENCKDNIFTITKDSIVLKYGAGLQVGQDGRYFVEDLNQQSKISKERTLIGVFPKDATLKIVDATKQNSPAQLFSSSTDKAPVLVGVIDIIPSKEYYFSIYNPESTTSFAYKNLPKIFQQAEEARKEIANRIKINTPDSFINALGGTLAIASDATWENPTYLHGSIGWRMRLNGWRGAYTADALGWHDRAKTHLESYLLSEVKTPDAGSVIADTATHLSRSLEKLGVGMFTSGYISRDPNGKNLRAHHYDMNLVFVDIMLRHFNWTGDTVFLRKTWPFLQRHLAWEKRNFDADGDGLYDAYAAIWASDAMQYSGGGVAHTSAYNYYENLRAAEIAIILGEDATPYLNEANKILKAMNTLLWLPNKGTFAEFKDALCNQLLHPSAGLWTIYHSMDSKVPNPFQAYLSMRYVDNEIPHIPIKAKGLKDEGYYTISTTNWMPYTWSLNNVALAESGHTALANWQAGRNDEAFKLFKSELIASQYLGGSPGNIVQISYYDASRGEAYRDFGDPVGVVSRAVVEGLFGILPNALHQELLIKPGIPASWNFASFATPDISFDFKRNGKIDSYKIESTIFQKSKLKFQIFAQAQVKTVWLNGKKVLWKCIENAVGKPMIEIVAQPSLTYHINIEWEGKKPTLPSTEKTYTTGGLLQENFVDANVIKVYDPQQVLAESKINATSVSAKVVASVGNYTVFVQLKQGVLTWWMPLCFKVKKAVEVISVNTNEQNTNSFYLKNNTTSTISAAVAVNSFKTSISIAAGQTSNKIIVPENDLITGTNPITITLNNGTVINETLYNWLAETKLNFETVDLTKQFNDKVTQIFKNKYLSPRPATTTLQLPWQGVGDWPHFAEIHEIDDSGLRKLADKQNKIILPQGIPFATSGNLKDSNIIFTSQWDNYPKAASIALSGKSSHAYFLMAGSTNPMQSQLNNGLIIVHYTDGTYDSLALKNPETWWPIEKDYYTDGFAFALKQPRPIRIHLKTGKIVNGEESKAKFNGKEIEGGAATVLDLPLNNTKTLKSVELKTIANDVVIGLMAITLVRE